MSRTAALSLTILLFIGLACSSARQITTPPPLSGVPHDSASVEHRTNQLRVVLEIGSTPLPPGISSLRFQVAEIATRLRGGGWTALPADTNPFVLPRDTGARQIILTAPLPAERYDSLAVSFRDVFVLFNENSGSALGTPGDQPIKLALPFSMSASPADSIELRFEPGASILHTQDCHWYFVPFIVSGS